MADSKTKLILPADSTLVKAMKLSIKHNKPIDCYFYLDSTRGNVSLMSDGETTLIYKNDDEHTSPMLKCFTNEHDFIIITENSIYIIHSATQVKTATD